MTTTNGPIDQNGMRFISPYQIDDVGRVFEMNGGIYRNIHPDHVDFYRTVLTSKYIGDLFRSGLVETDIVDEQRETGSLVVEHKRVPFVSYCMEWNFEMFRDAALLVCDLGARLAREGLTLKDAHPWNVLFDGCRPVFVDLGSIVPGGPGRPWPYIDFRQWFLFPLYLLSMGKVRLARALMHDVRPSCNRGDISRLLLGRYPWRRLVSFIKCENRMLVMSRTPDPKFFAALREFVSSIPAQSESTDWTAYSGLGDRHGDKDKSEWPEKMQSVDNVLTRLRPASVLDVGCNKGWFTELALKAGATAVVGGDVDEPSLISLYARCKSQNIPILPLLIDICTPTPVHGIGGIYSAATSRLRAEFVMSLATVHHLALRQGLRVDAICAQFSELCTKWLLVEYIPKTDAHIRDWVMSENDGYTEDGFHSELRKHFRKVQKLPSSPSPRILFFCER